MKYIGEFADVDKNLYEIDIITNNDSSQTENVMLGEDPIITTLEGEDENMFKPIKFTGSTINLVTPHILPDIYSSVVHGTKVTLKKINQTTGAEEIKWIGYVTPNLYNQDYNNLVDELEIECIDGLSTLQYIDYAPIDETRKIKSFKDIILNIIRKCECYKYIYVSSSVHLNETDTENLLAQLKISESNFFDEDDEALKCDEVLEEICKYAGLTATAEGDSVYFLDYETLDSIRNYYKIDVNTGEQTITEVIDQIFIDKKSFKESKTQVSLGPTYNKIKVTDSLYSIDELTPSLDDNDLLKNNGGFNWTDHHSICYPVSGGDRVCYGGWYKFYSHPYFKCYHYNAIKTHEDEPVDVNITQYDELNKYRGGNIIKAFLNKNKTDEFGHVIDPASLDYKTYLYIDDIDNTHPQDAWKNPEGEFEWKPAVEILPKGEFCTGDNNISGGAYVIIDGSVNFCTGDTKNVGNGYHAPNTEIEVSSSGFDPEQLYIECVLTYGGRYFSHIDEYKQEAVWKEPYENNIAPFRLMLDCDDNRKQLFNKDFHVKSNITYTMGLNTTSGFAIKLPPFQAEEPPKLTIIKTRRTVLDKKDRPETGYWISDFKFDIELAYSHNDEVDFNSDTEYENIIDENYVNEFDEVEFKICTWDNKEANYSAVLYNDKDGHLLYLDTLHTLRQTARSEELYINKMVRQYSKPPLIVEMVGKNEYHCYSVIITNMFGQEDPVYPNIYILNGGEINWKYNTNKIKLNLTREW